MSYRPISLLLTLGKLMEKLMTQRLNYHLSTTKQSSSRQFGFREGRSIDQALDELMKQVDKCRGQKNHTAIISIDIQGAFDNLTHKSIDEKLTENNCPCNINSMFSNLLKDKKVIIPTNDGVAQHIKTRGCPQGSRSGPALWNLVADEALN
ncbi:hypothetical protein AVEN_183986-1 [Araneus ventricosus]|uniref:Reverse transcriptase domain-containing protein n=1 Tax=Araneus ventricosus TaxID=182803 RepID=A0A4Y2E3E6_ARAVE|nr:hypothetical protein AVEN_183986-1 [Araneus ventricosus]